MEIEVIDSRPESVYAHTVINGMREAGKGAMFPSGGADGNAYKGPPGLEMFRSLTLYAILGPFANHVGVCSVDITCFHCSLPAPAGIYE